MLYTMLLKFMVCSLSFPILVKLEVSMIVNHKYLDKCHPLSFSTIRFNTSLLFKLAYGEYCNNDNDCYTLLCLNDVRKRINDRKLKDLNSLFMMLLPYQNIAS